MAVRTSCALILTLCKKLYFPWYMYDIWYVIVNFWFLIQIFIIFNDFWIFLNEKTIFFRIMKKYIFDKKNIFFIFLFSSNLIEKINFHVFFNILWNISLRKFIKNTWNNNSNTGLGLGFRIIQSPLKYIILIIFQKKTIA